MKQSFTVKDLTRGGAIAALYVVLTLVAHAFGLDSKSIQFRLSEALTILPVFTFAAVPGLTVGCVLANLIAGCVPWDVVLGSVATLLGAIGTWLLRKKPKIAWLPPVLSNMFIIPIVIIFFYPIEPIVISIPFTDIVLNLAGDSYLVNMITVGIGEVVCCGILGMLLYKALKKVPHLFD